MPSKKVTSIKVNPEIWKQAKKCAIDQGMTLSEFIEELLRKELGKKEADDS